jgi:hypothetical protein
MNKTPNWASTPHFGPLPNSSHAAQVPNASPSRIRADRWGPLVSLSLCCSLALSGWWRSGVSDGFSSSRARLCSGHRRVGLFCQLASFSTERGARGRAQPNRDEGAAEILARMDRGGNCFGAAFVGI